MESEKNHMTQKRISLQEVFGLYHFVKASPERPENNKVNHISGLKPVPKQIIGTFSCVKKNHVMVTKWDYDLGKGDCGDLTQVRSINLNKRTFY